MLDTLGDHDPDKVTDCEPENDGVEVEVTDVVWDAVTVTVDVGVEDDDGVHVPDTLGDHDLLDVGEPDVVTDVENVDDGDGVGVFVLVVDVRSFTVPDSFVITVW